MTPDPSSLLDECRRLISDACSREIPPLTPELSFVDLGLDSLDRLRALIALEQRFGLELDEETAARLERFSDLLALMENRRG